MDKIMPDLGPLPPGLTVAPDGVSPPQFVLVLQDNVHTGEVEVAGVQRPEAFDNTSAAHVIGGWIKENLGQIFEAARGATAVQPQPLRAPSGALVLGHTP